MSLAKKLGMSVLSSDIPWETILLSMNIWDPARGFVDNVKYPLSSIGLIINYENCASTRQFFSSLGLTIAVLPQSQPQEKNENIAYFWLIYANIAIKR